MSAAGFAGSAQRREVVRGVCEQVVRVRVPVPGVFREAVFFLNPDYARRGDLSREELLRQARAAAEGYLAERLPRRRAGIGAAAALAGLVGMALGLGLGVLLPI